ncbi:hypothetical protein CRM89_00025 [Nocardia sp. FDAARGOS_372]|uniref:hypothetical protein n=1 Tax=Nocardia sp. FDAARGOS_372 TaxID=2018066 RepID=UPI000BF060F2|nr:hypothetical protein [Nocardia sp. FDAARGOS_372]PEH74579.1 hypothetical protein CRM89_00025 [Nocardia sp. FDAARGOS_372]
MGTTWADVSQHQRIAVDASYPHPVFCFRTNSGDKIDTLAIENAVRAQDLIKAGQIQAVIAYYFFWPGQANCDLHKTILEQAGCGGPAAGDDGRRRRRTPQRREADPG